MISAGGVYPIAFDVLDATGALAHAATATLTITLPDGTTATPAITDAALAGQYRLPYQTTIPGRYTAHATTTGPVTAWDDEWDADPTPWPAIVSLSDTKKQLNIDPADHGDDDELLGFIAGTTGAIENYKHETIVRRMITDEIDLRGCGYGGVRQFRLWTNPPVISLTSVVAWDGSVTWDVTTMRVSAAGVVRVMTGIAVSGLVDVTLAAGYQAVPANYKRGALVMLEHLWSTQRGVGTINAGVIGPEEHFRQPGEFFTVPNKTKEWVGPPRPVVA